MVAEATFSDVAVVPVAAAAAGVRAGRGGQTGEVFVAFTKKPF